MSEAMQAQTPTPESAPKPVRRRKADEGGDLNAAILEALQGISKRLDGLEERVDRTEKRNAPTVNMRRTPGLRMQDAAHAVGRDDPNFLPAPPEWIAERGEEAVADWLRRWKMGNQTRSHGGTNITDLDEMAARRRTMINAVGFEELEANIIHASGDA